MNRGIGCGWKDCLTMNNVDFYTVTVNKDPEIVLDKTEHFDIGESDALNEVIPKEYSFVNDQIK